MSSDRITVRFAVRHILAHADSFVPIRYQNRGARFSRQRRNAVVFRTFSLGAVVPSAPLKKHQESAGNRAGSALSKQNDEKQLMGHQENVTTQRVPPTFRFDRLATPPPSYVNGSGSTSSPQSLLKRLSEIFVKMFTLQDHPPVRLPQEKDANPIVVDLVETSIYLDSSLSMNEYTSAWNTTTRLSQGKHVLRTILPALGSQDPVRVLTFSSVPSLVMPRSTTGSSKSLQKILEGGWESTNCGGTYLWHMIEQDVLYRYRPGQSKLRLIVVTDGDDNCSPTEYLGVEGMHPMMQTLHQAGYDVEWHIVVVGDDEGLEGYETLAGATGGTFVAVNNNLDENRHDIRAMVDAIQKSTDEQGRRDRQQTFKESHFGRLEWFKELPSGK